MSFSSKQISFGPLLSLTRLVSFVKKLMVMVCYKRVTIVIRDPKDHGVLADFQFPTNLSKDQTVLFTTLSIIDENVRYFMMASFLNWKFCCFLNIVLPRHLILCSPNFSYNLRSLGDGRVIEGGHDYFQHEHVLSNKIKKTCLNEFLRIVYATFSRILVSYFWKDVIAP